MSKYQHEYIAVVEFVKILHKYMEKFGLEAIDIAFLSESTRINIQNLIDFKGSLEIERMELIANAFNLHHYQFSNPNQVIPEIETIPERTQQRIQHRKVKGPYIPETRKSLTINDKITIFLSFLNINDEFLTKEIVEIINNVDADDSCDASLVGDRLKKSFSSYVEKTTNEPTGKKNAGGKAFFFRIIAKMPELEVNNAKNELGEYWFENYRKLTEGLEKDKIEENED